MSRIGVFFAEGFEEIEALTVVDVCRRAGVEVQMVSVSGDRTVSGSHGINVQMDMGFDEVDFDSLDMIVLPGGKLGTENLEAHQGLMEQVDAFDRAGKYLAAICAAPSILGHRGILKGRRAGCYPGWEKHLEGAQVSMDDATVDGHVITGRGMGCSIAFSMEIVARLQGVEQAVKVAESIVYRRR
ncbi:MAG: DJ-1/PfpI family protein [bacterium]|nr:DJ-1/PfpI family protein [bacterium]MCM1374313.1 DJ-1/PfpI family protein [Muribaculum sp.]